MVEDWPVCMVAIGRVNGGSGLANGVGGKDRQRMHTMCELARGVQV